MTARSGLVMASDQSLQVGSGRAVLPLRVLKTTPLESPFQLRRPHRATVPESCTGDSNQPFAPAPFPILRIFPRLPVAASVPLGDSIKRVASPSFAWVT